MKIWKKDFTIDKLNELNKDTATENLGIKITNVGDNTIEGEMPVDSRTCQIRRLLHGGASALLIETLGSIGGHLAVDDEHTIVGLEINANHVAGISSGFVKGVATASHIGRTTHVWEVKIFEKETNKLICLGRITLAVIKPKV